MKKWNLIVLDVDGVLSDFLGSALKLMNAEHPDIVPWTKENWPKGETGIESFYDLTPKEFWGRIADEEDFWYNLPKLPHADALVKYCKEQSERMVVMTSPAMHSSCYSQKYRWIKKNLKIAHKNIIIGGAKELLARPDRLLIDDSVKKYGRFVEAGGKAILFPSEQNWNWKISMNGDPLAYVKDCFKLHGDLRGLDDE